MAVEDIDGEDEESDTQSDTEGVLRRGGEKVSSEMTALKRKYNNIAKAVMADPM